MPRTKPRFVIWWEAEGGYGRLGVFGMGTLVQGIIWGVILELGMMPFRTSPTIASRSPSRSSSSNVEDLY
ncbi:hypothetical protein BT69DRAFT_1291156, partial [Atractiella rhizophila]